MKSNITLKTTLTSAIIACFFIAMGQTGPYEGDNLGNFVGKRWNDPQLKELENHYDCQMQGRDFCVSKGGLELMLKDSVISQINLYKNSQAFGVFKGILPMRLTFGMTVDQVELIMGKPRTQYKSGYSERANQRPPYIQRLRRKRPPLPH